MLQVGPHPVANATTPYWRSELHAIDSVRSSEELPTECDVLIIGAGMSGVSVAYHLFEGNPSPPSVVLLEAREICSGATARNGGHTSLGHGAIDVVTKAYGPEDAKELVLFQLAQIYAMKHAAEKENIDCDFLMTRLFETYLSQDQADEHQAIYEKELDAKLDYIQDVNFVGPKLVQRVSGVKDAKAAISNTGCQFWPYKFVTGLLANLLERTSINVQTHTPVTSVTTTSSGSSIVKTPRGSIRARKVVFASNAYTSGILPAFSNKIMPTKITNSHIKVPSNTPFPAPQLNQTYGLTFRKGERDYLIPRPDGGVICGGAKATYQADVESWFDNFDDSTLLSPAAREHFETVMQDNFYGWENSGAAVDYIWTGIEGITVDQLPHCGQVPGAENHFILAGFNGNGMGWIFLTGKGVAHMVRDGLPFEEVGIPRIFKSTAERLEKDVKPVVRSD